MVKQGVGSAPLGGMHRVTKCNTRRAHDVNAENYFIDGFRVFGRTLCVILNKVAPVILNAPLYSLHRSLFHRSARLPLLGQHLFGRAAS